MEHPGAGQGAESQNAAAQPQQAHIQFFHDGAAADRAKSNAEVKGKRIGGGRQCNGAGIFRRGNVQHIDLYGGILQIHEQTNGKDHRHPCHSIPQCHRQEKHARRQGNVSEPQFINAVFQRHPTGNEVAEKHHDPEQQQHKADILSRNPHIILKYGCQVRI